MRSNMITVAAVVAGIFLAAPMATATDVQEQLRLMEQRMAEMEDRLQATSDELDTAKSTVEEQQVVLSEAGLAADDEGLRSGSANFFKMVDVSGVVAASYNYRFIDGGPNQDDQSQGGNVGLFRHPDANTFALDQLWMVIDKPVTEESRAGFHAEYVYGKTAEAQGGSSGFSSGGSSGSDTDYDSSGLLYTAYVSYLAPMGDGVQIDAGKLGTPLGAEVLQTNQNYNITTGLVFGLQPVTHVGIQAATPIADNLNLVLGFANDVYSTSNFDTSDNKAFYGQLQFSSDMFDLNVGAIVGQDSGLSVCDDADDNCYTSVFDIVLAMQPCEDFEMWINFDWARHFGEGDGLVNQADGDAYGFATAGRYAFNDETGLSGRIEYVRMTPSFNSVGAVGGGTLGSLMETLSATLTVDHALTNDLKLRVEGRLDHALDEGSNPFVNGNNGSDNNGGTPTNSSSDLQGVLLAELAYEF